MLYYAEINYYEFVNKKNGGFAVFCKREKLPEGYYINEVRHRPFQRELYGYFEAETEEKAKTLALLSFTSWLKNHMTTIEITIGHLEESVKEIEKEIEKNLLYKVSYSKIVNSGDWIWEAERVVPCSLVCDASPIVSNVTSKGGYVFVKAFSTTEAIKLAKKKVYGEVYKQKNAFDPLLNSCAEAFGE